MATTYQVLQIAIVTSSVSAAALDTALAAAVQALEVLTNTVPNSISISELGVYTVGVTFTYSYTIFYYKSVTV